MSTPSRGAKRQHATPQARLYHWREQHRREAGSSFKRLATTPLSTLMTVLVMTVALTLPLALGLLLADAKRAMSTWDADARISVYLRDGLDGSTQQNALAKAQQTAGVREARLITPEVALAEFRGKAPNAATLQLLGENPLPAVVEVFPSDTTDAAAMDALRDTFATWSEVAVAELDTAWVQRLRDILTLGSRLLWALGGSLLLGGLLVVVNTIRLNIESRRDEIRVISLLGGTHAFVRRPFIYMGVWCGLSAGFFTLLTVSVLIAWLNGPVTSLSNLYGSDFALSYPSLGTSFSIMAGAAALGWLGAWLAASRHLYELEP